jgi:hypothetical protein
MKRHWAVETRFREHAEEPFPIDHALAHGAVPLLPRAAIFFPEEVLERDHRQSRRHQVERCAPPSVSTFDDCMTGIEVIPDGCRIEPLDVRRKIPDRAADVPRVVVIPEAHPVTPAQIGKSSQLCAGGFELFADINELISVVARLVERNLQPRCSLQRRLRDRIRVG